MFFCSGFVGHIIYILTHLKKNRVLGSNFSLVLKFVFIYVRIRVRKRELLSLSSEIEINPVLQHGSVFAESLNWSLELGIDSRHSDARSVCTPYPVKQGFHSVSSSVETDVVIQNIKSNLALPKIFKIFCQIMIVYSCNGKCLDAYFCKRDGENY